MYAYVTLCNRSRMFDLYTWSPLIYKFCTRYWTEREIRDGLKCMCAVVIIILDRVPTCVGVALSQIPTGFFATPACF